MWPLPGGSDVMHICILLAPHCSLQTPITCVHLTPCLPISVSGTLLYIKHWLILAALLFNITKALQSISWLTVTL